MYRRLADRERAGIVYYTMQAIAEGLPQEHGRAALSARLPTLDELDAASTLIYATMPPTPQYRWPLLEKRAGAEL
jgi:hypothetical protein